MYMGLDDKLKIRGLNSEYFTIYLACLVGFLLFAGLSVLSALTGSLSACIEILLEVVALLVIYTYFHRKSNRPKMPKKTNALTISNREIYRTLYK